MASQVPEGKQIFIFSQSNARLSLSGFGGELKEFGCSRAGLVLGANLFTVKFSGTRRTRTCDWTEAGFLANGQTGRRRGRPDRPQLLGEV